MALNFTAEKIFLLPNST